MQALRGHGPSQSIVGPGEMVDTDPEIAAGDELFGYSCGLIGATIPRGQLRFIDPPLIGLAAWKMGVTKAGNPPRRQRYHRRTGPPDRFDCLHRKPIHQIEAQLANACRTQTSDRRLHHAERLKPADCSLHQRIDVLNPQAGARDAECRKDAGKLDRYVAWIELDRMLHFRLERKAVMQRRDDRTQSRCAENAGSSAAPVQPADARATGENPTHHRDFTLEGLAIAIDDLVPYRHLGVAAAIKADLAAIRHVKIEREALATKAPQAPSVVLRRYQRREIRRSGI